MQVNCQKILIGETSMGQIGYHGQEINIYLHTVEVVGLMVLLVL